MRYRRLKMEGATYFFTVVTFDRRPIFAGRAAVDLLSDAIAEIRGRYPFTVEAQVILPDHLHAMWSLPANVADYSQRWSLIKAVFSRRYARTGPLPSRDASRRRKREQTVWQRRFWEHLVHDDEDYGTHLDYIHYNPVKHGFVLTAGEWPHSTFGEWVARGVYPGGWGSDREPKLPPWSGRE